MVADLESALEQLKLIAEDLCEEGLDEQFLATGK